MHIFYSIYYIAISFPGLVPRPRSLAKITKNEIHIRYKFSITDRNNKACFSTKDKLVNFGFRAEIDIRNEKVGFKIREHTMQRIPFLIIIGDKEQENNEISVRTREGKDLGNMTIDKFKLIIDESISKKGIQVNQS